MAKVVNWAIEAGAPNALLRRGLRKTDFPIGLEIAVGGYRAKNGTPTANGTTVKFANGRNFFVGRRTIESRHSSPTPAETRDRWPIEERTS